MLHIQISLQNRFDSSSFITYSSSICPIMLCNSTGSATDTNGLRIAVSCFSSSPRAPIEPIHAAISHGTNLLPPSHRSADSDVPVRHGEAAFMEPLSMSGEADVLNAFLPSDSHATWAHYPRINSTWDMLENSTATTEQSCNEQ